MEINVVCMSVVSVYIRIGSARIDLFKAKIFSVQCYTVCVVRVIRFAHDDYYY